MLDQPKKHTFLYGRRSEYFVQYFNLHKQQDGYKNIKTAYLAQNKGFQYKTCLKEQCTTIQQQTVNIPGENVETHALVLFKQYGKRV